MTQSTQVRPSPLLMATDQIDRSGVYWDLFQAGDADCDEPPNNCRTKRYNLKTCLILSSLVVSLSVLPTSDAHPYWRAERTEFGNFVLQDSGTTQTGGKNQSWGYIILPGQPDWSRVTLKKYQTSLKRIEEIRS